MIFDTDNMYRVGGVLLQLNNNLQENNTFISKDITETTSLDYLKSIGEYPDSELTYSNEKMLTGQLISSIILSHIELDDQIYSSKRLEQGSLESSFSFEFHPNTFHLLFDLIERSATLSSTANAHILTVCLRLFTTHLRFLSASRTDIQTFANDDQLTKWFHLLLKFACDESQKSISVTASKGLVDLINLPTWSFIQKLSFIHQYIEENRYKILLEQLFIELNREETIMDWIELLCNNNDEKISDKTKALNILYSFIDHYSISFEKQRILMILSSFHQLLIYRLVPEYASFSTSSLFIQYITHLFKKSIMTDLIKSLLAYLPLMTKTNTTFNFSVIQPIFAAILPLLSDFLVLQINQDQNQLRFISWLIGKMTQIMITSSSLDSLESKHIDKLKLILFANGCETSVPNQNEYLSQLFQSNLAISSEVHRDTQEKRSSTDEKFLLSIYNNIDEGAQLISRIKKYAKNKQHLLQKSIEQLANELTAAVFAVYIKHYRRINLARRELSQTDEIKPSIKLLSIFDYANHVQTVLATIKAQDRDCEAFAKQIKAKTLVLLESVKESNVISITNEVLTSAFKAVPKKEGFAGFERQLSHGTQAKQAIELLQQLMEACNRFRKSIVTKKQTSDVKINNEHLLNRAIDQFLYEDFYKVNTSVPSETTDVMLNELKSCLHRQYERAITRLITYRFAQRFVEKLCNLNDEQSVRLILFHYLPYLRNSEVEWSYLENIYAANNQLQDEIRMNYYLIIKTILQSTIFQSIHIQQHVFYLSNINYKSVDMDHLLPEKFFKSEDFEKNAVLDLKLTTFNWFRLFAFKLCENIQLELFRGINNERLEQQRTLVFDKFILNELQKCQQMDLVEKSTNNSLKNISLGWFHRALTSEKGEIDLYINQYLVILFRCLHFYEHIQQFCATMDFITELFNIYHQSKHNITRLLILKITRELIPRLSQKIDPTAIIIEKFIEEILVTIGQNFIVSSIEPEIVTELINIYRTILSNKSLWQTMAIQMICSAMKTTEMNKIIASLCILGGYISPYCLSSIIKVYNDDDFRLGLIIDVSDNSSYTVQCLQTNQIASVSIDKIEQEIVVAPPDLLMLPTIDNEVIHSVLDILGNWIQLTTESLIMLQIKRRAIAVLAHMLTNQSIIEIFIQKPYAIALIQFAISDSLLSIPDKLRLFNKQHLEQYCLSLDNCNQWKDQDITNEKTNSSNKYNPLIVKALSTSVLKYNGWKPYVSNDEIQLFKKGRLGNDEILIVSMPSTAADSTAMKPCGMNHQFNGRVNPTSDNTYVSLPTFVIDNLKVSEGNWYYCVRLPKDGVQIGWATHKFNPRGNDGKGLGDDQYSWAYDGSRGLFLNDGVYDKQFNDIRWNENDVCGCGIEIDGEKTNIKYWLNGKLLGTAFKHQSRIPSSYTNCDLLPNEQITPFYPGITLQLAEHPSTYCEFIFSPEDMQQCPLPDGYKPLLLPKLVDTENSIVAYPFSAYLVGDETNDYMYTSRTKVSNSLLRDFVHERHLQTEFLLNDQYYLILTENSTGFPISMDEDVTSFTIAFDFQISTSVEIISLISDVAGNLIVKIPFSDEETRVVLVFDGKTEQTKVYMNQNCQTFETSFPDKTIKFYLLPKIEARIRNIGIWKYALPEDHVQRFLLYGIFYVATDYQQMKEYRKRANTFTFEKKEFPNESLIPFDQSFERNIWKLKQKQADANEIKYFSTTDSSVLEFFGNKTYLVLEKSIETWFQYTLILDVSIPKWPNKDKQLSLVTLNDKTQIFITNNGKLCLQNERTNNEGESEITNNEFFRLWICVENQSIKIHMNESLEINLDTDDDRYDATLDHFDFFREINPEKNDTDENTTRVQCRSITFLNQAKTISEKMQTPDQSLESLITSPLSVITPNLIAIGYKKQWIQSVIEEFKTTNIQMIDTILREQKQRFLQLDTETQQNNYKQILSRITPEIDFSNTIGNGQLNNIAERILTEWTDDKNQKETNVDDDNDDDIKENQWFHRSIKGLDITESLTEWLQDQSTTISEPDIMHQLFDINQQTAYTKNHQKSVYYTHRDISQERYFDLRLACENALATVYARDTILTILEVWSNNSTTLFPLEKFGNPSFIIPLFRLMSADKKIDRISTILYSIIKSEYKDLIENQMYRPEKTLLIIQLRNEIVLQSLRFLFESSSSEETTTKPIIKILNIFIKLFKDKSLLNEDQLDRIISVLFPTPLIKILFDLFLKIHNHQSKNIILQLFTTLSQASRNFQLNRSIQDFSIELLITLSSDESKTKDNLTKSLRQALMDFVFVIFMKQHSSRLTDLPQNIRDLYTVINVINALIDPTKQAHLPEIFFIQSKHILGNVLQINRDEFDKCQKYFNFNSDQQLIHAMNKSLTQNSSFGEFLRNLPTESNPNETFYQTYLFLANNPTDSLLIRAKFLYQLNKLIEKILSMVDLSVLPGESVLSDQIRAVKSYLLTTTKFELFKECLEKTETDYNYDTLEIKFDTVEASLTNERSDNTMFHQAYRQLHANAQTIFRRSNEQLWQSQYVGMHSTDAGGPYRDSITCICSDICSARLPLFILCPNGRTNNGLNRDCWIPNSFPPNKSIPNKFQKQYRFIGQLMGFALRKKHYLNLKFPPLVWKQLLKESITVDDIKAIDVQSFAMIDEMEKNIEEAKSIDTDNQMDYLVGTLLSELRFDVVSSAGETYELIPGGMEIQITTKNFQQYCTFYRHYRLNEFYRQIEFIRQGLSSIVPCYYLSLFTADELEKAVCGEGEIDIQLLKRNTKYENGFTQDSPVIERFWTLLKDRFNEEQKRLFLIFVWGRSILPNRDEDFTTKFTITTYDVNDSEVDKTLPQSHTCSFTIDLPRYSTVDIMYERLNYAITYCSSIDNDGTINEVAETMNSQQMDSSDNDDEE
ncbi:hypothetical protein I4U23_023423 [Adineta vaga]|nr:hypothetical protein I4U23_023423 [Adineta vaga]